MKKIALILLAMLIITGCGDGGGSGNFEPKEKEQEELNYEVLKVIPLVSNVSKDSVFRSDSMGYYSMSQSIHSIDSEKINIFEGVDGFINSINVISESIFLSSVYSYEYDDRLTSMITYINDGSHVTYELDAMDSLRVEFMQAKLVGDVVVINTGSEFFYVTADGKKYTIEEENSPYSFHTDGKHIAYFTKYHKLNVITLDGKVKVKADVKDASILAVDDGNVILAMYDDFECHPIDYGRQPDLYGNYFLGNCDLYDASKDKDRFLSQIYHMKPIVKFNIDSEESEPWVWISVFSETESSSISYINGHIFFNEIKQDIRAQNPGKFGLYKEYKGKNIPLVGMENFCSGVEETYMYAPDPVGIIKEDNGKVYCFEHSYREINGKTQKDHIKITVNYLNGDGDYVNDGTRRLARQIYELNKTHDAFHFLISNDTVAFRHYEHRYTFNTEINLQRRFELDKAILFTEPMQKFHTIYFYDHMTNRSKRKTPY